MEYAYASNLRRVVMDRFDIDRQAGDLALEIDRVSKIYKRDMRWIRFIVGYGVNSCMRLGPRDLK